MSRSIVVCTDMSGPHAATLAEAARRAKDEGATLILYDVGAAKTMSSQRPTIWAGEGEEQVYEHPLDPVALEKMGRHDFAVQVETLRQDGVDAFGWLPEGKGGDDLAKYAAAEGIDLVLVPADLADTYTTGFQATPGVEVAVV